MFTGHVMHCGGRGNLVMLHERQLRLITTHFCFMLTHYNTVRLDVLTVMVLKMQVF
jgi:hypothetical protein